MKNKSYLKTPTYRLNMSKLEDCDIVLTRDYTLTSFGVRLATWAPYSHAAIFFEDSFIDATKKGIFSKNPQRITFSSKDDFCVLRLIDKNKLFGVNLTNLKNYIRNEIGNSYSTKDAVMVKLSALKGNGNLDEQFCSRLVARAYGSVGVQLVVDPDFCSPKDLMNSSLLFELKDVYEELSENDLEYLQTENLPDNNFSNMAKWLDFAKDKAKEVDYKIQNMSDVFSFVMQYPEYDTVMVDAVKESGYLDDINGIIHNDSLLYFTLFQHIEMGLINKNDKEFCKDMSKRLDSSLFNFNRWLGDLEALMSVPRLKLVVLFVNNYKCLVEHCIMRVQNDVDILREADCDCGLNDKPLLKIFHEDRARYFTLIDKLY